MTKSKQAEASKKLSEVIVKGMQEKKALDIVIMDLREVKNAVADFFVICSGNSDKHLSSIAQSVDDEVFKTLNEDPWSKEGKHNKEWMLLDYVTVVVHIFKKDRREFYSLEKLWGDAVLKEIKESWEVKGASETKGLVERGNQPGQSMVETKKRMVSPKLISQNEPPLEEIIETVVTEIKAELPPVVEKVAKEAKKPKAVKERLTSKKTATIDVAKTVKAPKEIKPVKKVKATKTAKKAKTVLKTIKLKAPKKVKVAKKAAKKSK